MNNFGKHMGDAVTNQNKEGWLVSILELGAWFGVLCTGYLADKLSRKYSILFGAPHSVTLS
jgi:MFS family permease